MYDERSGSALSVGRRRCIVARDPDACPRCGLINPPGQGRCDTCGQLMSAAPSWAQRNREAAYLLGGLAAVGVLALSGFLSSFVRAVWRGLTGS
jgi:hypothetical protein